MTFDARSKLIFVLFTSLTYGMHLTDGERFCLVTFLSLLFLLASSYRMVFLNPLGFGLAYVFSQASFLPNWLVHLSFVLTYIWPPLMAGHFLLMTTSAYELIHGLRKWHLPESFLLTLGVMFRFLPMIKKELAQIHLALRSRGIVLARQPYRYGEYVLVPLMMSLLRTSQDLTVATLTKGLAMTKQPSEFVPSRWTWLDWSLCAWCLCFLVMKIS